MKSPVLIGPRTPSRHVWHVWLALLVPGGIAAQVDTGRIRIDEPVEWRNDATRGIEVERRSSLWVSGTAAHPSGVFEVRLNGLKASVELSGDPTELHFRGYVTVDEPSIEVEVRAVPRTGAPFTQSFRAEAPQPPTEAGQIEQWDRASAEFQGDRWALVVGISEYRDPEIESLQFAHSDAYDFAQFLLSPRAGLGGFDPDRVHTLINEQASYFGIRGALRNFLRQPGPDDVVYIFFAGHGAPDPTRPADLYLVPHDANAQDLATTGIPMEELREALALTQAREKILFIDACHSAGVGAGATTRGLSGNLINYAFLQDLENNRGVDVTITSSSQSQLSQEGVQWGGGHGVFTFFLLEGLQGVADRDGNRIVDLGELFDFVQHEVSRETGGAQTPQLTETAFNPRWPMSLVADDEDLAELLESAPREERERPTVTSAQFSAYADRMWSAPDSMIVAVGHRDTVVVRVEGPTGQAIPGHLFSWATTNPAVADVDRTGVIEPRSPGVATVTAFSNAGGSQQRREEVTIRVYPQPTGVRFDPEGETVEVTRGQSFRITAAIELPSTEIIRALVPRLMLADTTVLTLRPNGEFQAVREGQAEVTASVAGFTKRWMVRVNPALLRIDDTSRLMRLGTSRVVAASYFGDDELRISEALGAAWHASDPSVLEVEQSTVRAVGLGSAWLVASSASRQDSVRIDVVGELLATLDKDDENPSIHTISLGTGEAYALPGGRVDGTEPALSPDGRTIAFVSTEDVGRPRIFLMDTDGSNQRRLTVEDGGFLGLARFYREHSPSWSSDGQRIFFSSNRPGNYEILTIDVLSGKIERITENNALDERPQVAADGRYVWSRAVAKNRKVVVAAFSETGSPVDVSASRPSVNSRGRTVVRSERNATILPGGSRMLVAVETGEDGGESLELVDLESGQQSGSLVPALRGRKIVYAVSRDGKYVVYHQPPRDGAGPSRIVVMDLNGNIIRSFDLSGVTRIRDLSWVASLDLDAES